MNILGVSALYHASAACLVKDGETWRFDVAKGAVPVLAFGPGSDLPYFPTLCGIAAMVGHTLSPFVSFRGGKGVATATGMFLALAPKAIAVAAALWILLVWTTGYVSLGSVLSALSLPPAILLLHAERSRELVLVITALGRQL